jgi:hypothetical protein
LTLQAVFLDWIERLEKYIATDGEYVEWLTPKIAVEKISTRIVSRFSPLGGTPRIILS